MLDAADLGHYLIEGETSGAGELCHDSGPEAVISDSALSASWALHARGPRAQSALASPRERL
jgi:hypothetical protein